MVADEDKAPDPTAPPRPGGAWHCPDGTPAKHPQPDRPRLPAWPRPDELRRLGSDRSCSTLHEVSR